MREVVVATALEMALGVVGQSEARGQETSTPGSPASAQQQPPADHSPWSIGLTSYVWFAGLNGDIGVRNLPPAQIGYRYLVVNYDKDGFLFDGSIRGPIVGASIRF